MIDNQKIRLCLVPGVLPEEPESLPRSGVMTSPNYPANYPNDLHQREITDGDGTNLGHLTYHDADLMRRNITSNTETVDVLFHTDGSVTRRGWSLEWRKYKKQK